MEPAGSIVFWTFLILILAAPLYKAGNRPFPLLLLELAAIALLLAFVADGGARTIASLPRTLLVALIVAAGYPLLQLVPLPEGLWRALPGHADYAQVWERFADPSSRVRTISVVPSATEYGWLAMLPPVAALVVARSLSPRQVVLLLWAMVVLAGALSLLGLVQVAAGRNPHWHLGYTEATGMATGTYVNRDHFAAMLAMMLPVVLGLMLYGIRHARVAGGHRDDAVNAWSRRILVFASAVLMLICLVLTFSRAGIATALVGLGLLSVLLAAGGGRLRARLVVGGLAALGVGLAAAIGLDGILGKFDPGELRLSVQGRWALTTATMRAALDFLPFGSGLATFSEVFPRFQADVFGGYIGYAHNDYAQLLLELGLAAPLIVALAFAAYAMRMADLAGRVAGRSFTVLQIAAGVALLPPMLHALLDFGLHMPANAIWFATLAGVTFHPGVREGSREQQRARRAETAGPVRFTPPSSANGDLHAASGSHAAQRRR